MHLLKKKYNQEVLCHEIVKYAIWKKFKGRED